MRKKLIGTVLSALMLLTSCSYPTKAEETLIVGLEANYPPYNFTQNDDSNGAVKMVGSNGYANGYDVEIAKEIANKLGKKLVVKQIAWEGLIPAVNNGAIDLIVAGMSETEERKKAVDFSNPYYKTSFVLLTKSDSPFANVKNIKELTGAKIVGQKGTSYDKIIDQIPNVKHQTPLNTIPLIMNDIKKGSSDGTVVEKSVGISVTSANKDIKMIEFSEGNGFTPDKDIPTTVSVAMKKGNPIKDKVNEVLSTIDDNKREELMNKSVSISPKGGN